MVRAIALLDSVVLVGNKTIGFIHRRNLNRSPIKFKSTGIQRHFPGFIYADGTHAVSRIDNLCLAILKRMAG